MSAVNAETVTFDNPATVSDDPAATPDNVATETEATAADESQETHEPETPKTFTQEDVDRIAQKERAKAERRAIRQVGDELKTLRETVQQLQQQPQQQQQRAAGEGEPQRDQFESYEDYIRAIGRFEAKQELSKERTASQQREQQEAQQRYQQQLVKVAEQRIEAGRKEYADFDAVINEAAEEGTLPIGSPLHMAIIESDLGHKIAYHLAKNPEEAERLASLPQRQMDRELGKLEVKLAAAPVQKPKSKPINPVGGASSSSSGLRDDDDMDAWVKKRNAELRKR